MVQIISESAYEAAYESAKSYLTDKENAVAEIKRKLHYDTCHPIKGLDASICYKDCKKAEKGDFAKNCRKNQGFFKCCIRLAGIISNRDDNIFLYARQT